MAGIKNMFLNKPSKWVSRFDHGYFVGLSKIINFQNIFKAGDFLTAALNEQHLVRSSDWT